MDLFAELSDRGEVLDQLGLNGVALGTMAKIFVIMSALFTLPFMLSAADFSLSAYLTILVLITTFLVVFVLFSEAANSLMNPTEALVLSHQPINGATYTAAKLSHLLQVILFIVPSVNTIPALAGLRVPGVGPLYPLLHLAAAFIAAILAALLCFAFFGMLLRFIPVGRLNAAGQLAAALPFLVIISLQSIEPLVRHNAWLWDLLDRLEIRRWLSAQPVVRWALGLAMAAAVVAALAFGIRSLSVDYLIRVSSMIHGRSPAGSSGRTSRVTLLVRRFFGGQAGVAGFVFVSRMMPRDWQFRRAIAAVFLYGLLFLATLVSRGWPSDVFSGHFSPIHLLPHIMGMLLFSICAVLRYGNDYKGA